jgi:hypothetical protein
MNFENSDNNQGNSYHYSYTYITNHISDSFNTTHKNSHNGHGRASGCGLLLPLALVALPVIVSVIFCNVLAGWLT